MIKRALRESERWIDGCGALLNHRFLQKTIFIKQYEALNMYFYVIVFGGAGSGRNFAARIFRAYGPGFILMPTSGCRFLVAIVGRRDGLIARRVLRSGVLESGALPVWIKVAGGGEGPDDSCRVARSASGSGRPRSGDVA
jgi:hypothetical protein